MSDFKEAIAKMREIAELLHGDDEKLDILDTETDYTKLMNWAIIKRSEYIAQADAAKALIDKYDRRKKSFDNAADNMKDVVKTIMKSANETKFKSEAGTVSIKAVPPKPIIQDESKLPREFIKVKESVDKVAINKAIAEGQTIDGVTMDNGGESISIRV